MNAQLHGLLTEFERPEALVEAMRVARESGYVRVEAYSPYPIETLDALLPPDRLSLPWMMFLGGAAGALGGYGLQYYSMVISYPLNVGGRPLHSWPLYMPVVFELAVITAAIVGVVGMLAINGLPKLYHPLFNVERFAEASRDRFFLCIEAADPLFEREATAALLARLSGGEVLEVPD